MSAETYTETLFELMMLNKKLYHQAID